jgi:hypothetical protein
MATIASMVIQIGADIADLKSEVTKGTQTLDSMTSVAKKIGGALGVAFTVDQVVSFAGKVVKGASALTDLHAKTGISLDMLQRFDYAGGQVGVTLDDVTRGVIQLQKRLAGGEGTASAAMRELHLKTSDLLALDPGQMFTQIAQAVAAVESPAERTRLAIALLGKSGAELLPLLVENFEDLASGAAVMSDATVQRLDEIDDAISNLSKNAKVGFGTVLVAAMDVTEALGPELSGPVGSSLDHLNKALNATLKASDLVPIKKLGDDVKELKSPLTDAADKLKEFDEANKDAEDKMRKSIAAADAYRESVRGLADQFTGRKLAAEIKLSADAIREVGGVSGMTAAEQSKLAKQVGEWLAQGAKVPTVMHDVYRTHEDFNAQAVTSVAKWRELAASAAEYTAKVKDVITPLEDIKQADLGAILKNSIGNGALKDDELPKTFTQNFRAYLKKGLPDAINAAIIGGGDIFKAAGSSVGSFLVSKDGFGDEMTKGLKSVFGKGLGGAISDLLPGLGSLMGPLLSGIASKIGGLFKTGDGRKAVEDFASSFGGFDALHRKLGELGAAGEQYWIKLTQGVGKNNPAQAKQVIDEITAALAGNQQFLDGLVPDWQEAVDIAAKYGGTVEQLGPKFQQQQLSKQAEDLVVDMKKLQAAGASVNDILSFMGDDIQKVVKHAMQYGLEVPAAMKPVLQTMVDQGLLTDDKLDELIDRLAGGVPKAAQTAADEAKKKLGELSFEIPVTFKVGGADFAGDRAAAAHSGAMVVANGIRKFHAGAAKILPFGRLASDEVPAILQTGEAVIRRSAVQSLGAGTMAAINRGELPGGAVLDMSGLRADIAGLRESQERLALQQGDIIARAVRDGVLMAAVS